MWNLIFANDSVISSTKVYQCNEYKLTVKHLMGELSSVGLGKEIDGIYTPLLQEFNEDVDYLSILQLNPNTPDFLQQVEDIGLNEH